MGNEFFKEFDQAKKLEYTPYIGSQIKPNYYGKYINIDENSTRLTISECYEKATTSNTSNIPLIYIFGGSTVFGEYVRDSKTIPSLLSQYLCENGKVAKVVNLGDRALVSTQEVIKFILKLRDDKKPDLVIFYDGFNDIYASYQNDEPGSMHNSNLRKNNLNQSSFELIINLLLKSNSGRIIKTSITKTIKNKKIINYSNEKIKKLTDDTIKIYLNNVNLVKAVGHEYDIKTFFYWQPTLYNKLKLSTYENSKISRLNNEFLKKMWIDSTNKIRSNKNIVDLSELFSNNSETVFMDIVHTSEDANKIIAEQIGKNILKQIPPN